MPPYRKPPGSGGFWQTSIRIRKRSAITTQLLPCSLKSRNQPKARRTSMDMPKPSRRKTSAKQLEPIDWREFANDAVLKGNMSTLYRRPATEDPSAYASQEALLEISKRNPLPEQPPGEPTEGLRHDPSESPVDSAAPTPRTPTVGAIPTVSPTPTVGFAPTVGTEHAVGPAATVVYAPANPEQEPNTRPLKTPRAPRVTIPTVPTLPTVGTTPTVGIAPAVGPPPIVKQKIKAIRHVHDALTLAGQVLYKAMYGAADGSMIKSCTKGYRQLAAETHLDKDTVRDLISEF